MPSIPRSVHRAAREAVLRRRPAWVGRMLYRLCVFRKRTVLDNIATVFGDVLTSQEQKLLARRFYDHFWRLTAENFLMSFMDDRHLRSRVRVIGDDIVQAAASLGKGVLLLTGHFGNWEFAPVAAMSHFERFRGRFHLLRRPIGNRWIEKTLFGRFYRAGLDIIPKRGSLGRVMDALAKNDVVTFIMDQYARPDRDGILVEFFGKKAGTFKSLALVARASGAPVIPAFCYREDNGMHVMEFREALEWIEDADPDREIYLNTLGYNRALERMVLDHPDQWWWPHRRWKEKRNDKRPYKKKLI